jgi:xylose isomerase
LALRDLREQARARNRDELIRHLETFRLEIKPTVGIWYFAPGGGRFHDRYVPEVSVEERLEKAAGLARLGVVGIEAHYPNEVNEDNLHLYKRLEQESGIRLVTIIPNLFFDKEFEFGSLSNPMPDQHNRACDRLKATLELNREADTDFMVIWPGMDGYTYPLGTMFYWMWDSFEDSLAKAMDQVPGVRVALEPKPYEPAPNNIYRNTADGIIMAQDVEARLQNKENRNLLDQGHALVTLNPEVGHVRMGFEDLPYAFARVLKKARLGHTHWNSQPLGNYDQDLNVGVVAPEAALAGLYALKMYGYSEHFGIDINPERMPVETAVEISVQALNMLNEKLEKLPHQDIVDAYLNPANSRGQIEKILLRAWK